MALKKKRKKKRLVRKKSRINKTRVKKRLIKRRPKVRKKAARKIKRAKAKAPKEKVIGVVTHYFPKVRAGVVKLKAPLSIGEMIKIKGHTTDFTQAATSMQINHVPITKAKKGDEIGLMVNSRVRRNDVVYKA